MSCAWVCLTTSGCLSQTSRRTAHTAKTNGRPVHSLHASARSQTCQPSGAVPACSASRRSFHAKASSPIMRAASKLRGQSLGISQDSSATRKPIFSLRRTSSSAGVVQPLDVTAMRASFNSPTGLFEKSSTLSTALPELIDRSGRRWNRSACSAKKIAETGLISRFPAKSSSFSFVGVPVMISAVSETRRVKRPRSTGRELMNEIEPSLNFIGGRLPGILCGSGCRCYLLPPGPVRRRGSTEQVPHE